AALAGIGGLLPSDRLSCFLKHPRDLLLEHKLSLRGGMRQELDEEIHLIESSPIAQLLEGRKGQLVFRAPHPILYVPLAAPGEPGSAARGVLRLERRSFGRRAARPFSATERATAAALATELAQSLHQAAVAHRSREQLKRLEALTELTAIFASSLRVEDGLRLILQGIQQHFALDRVRLYLVERSKDESGPGQPSQPKQLRGELSVDVKGQVRSLKAEVMPLIPGSHRFVDLVLGGRAKDPLLERYLDTVLHIPLTVQGQSIGLLVVDNLTSQEEIGAGDVGLLRSFAGQIALAVDNARLFDEVQALSLYDTLTGLPVRRYFNQRFQEEIYRAQRFGQPLSIALMDIDYYKHVNDTYGHQVGDQVLQEVGRLILANLRKIDFPCRYGGDEIIVLLPQSREDDARVIMERLAQQIREVRIPVPFSKAREVSVTTSIGLASYPEDGRTTEELVQRADEALYWVKSHGKDGVSSYSETRRGEKVEEPEA
ncbi:MAG: sensor domain-containing diguanylate cyclase, partial [Elusimicrobia bacterium]|nr:sensor domain-containing diguanylate cyclase [Elusimicrobiota bacterium]